MSLERRCNGIDIMIDEYNRKPEIEEQRNIHIGKPYRVQVQTCVYDGILKSIEIHLCEEGFIPLRIELEQGFFYHAGDPYDKHLFDHKVIQYGEINRMCAFGRIIDEEGFNRARDRAREKGTKKRL